MLGEMVGEAVSAGALYVVNSDDLSGMMTYPDRPPGLTHGAYVDDLAVLVLLFGHGLSSQASSLDLSI